MKHTKFHKTLIVGVLLASLVTLGACNEEKESEIYQNPVNLAVTKFSLKRDASKTGIDSTFFSIDLQHGVIFNADSLPKGTEVNKLVPVITYDERVESATITMTGGTTRQGDVDYMKNPTDSIDFTGDVTLRLTADKGTISTSYRLKVNVHREEADSMRWNNLADTPLPSRMPGAKKQKTVEFHDEALCLIAESDGSHTLARTSDISTATWSATTVSFPFTPEISSFTATTDALYILADNGDLYESTDAMSWHSTEQKWESMIGAYTTTVIGMRRSDGKLRFAQYPTIKLRDTEVPADFPVRDASNFVTLANKWTLSPVGFMVGGADAAGNISDATWAFDGSEWIKLSQGGIPAITGSSLVSYYHFRRSASGDAMNEYKVWLMLGGKKADGEYNRKVYVSYDNGVNWSVGGASLQLPGVIPPFTGCDNIVMSSPKSSNLSDAWKKHGLQRLPYQTNGDLIEWECPYIYLIGGYDANGTLYDTIWRGVLTRLTFTPII